MKKCFLFLVLSALSIQAQTVTTWNNGAGDQTWSNGGNWSAGVPNSLSNVQFGTQPTGDLIYIDSSSPSPVTVASITFNNTLASSMQLVAGFGTEILQVDGSITNLNSNGAGVIALPFIAGGTGTWSGSLTFSNSVNLGGNAITLASGSTTFSGSDISLTINSTSSYGQFLGSGSTIWSGSTINISGNNYTANVGDTFDFTSGSFTGASMGALPTLGANLVWDTTQFSSQGLLTVVSAVPEPSTYALMGMGMVGLLIAYRRRRLVPATVSIEG